MNLLSRQILLTISYCDQFDFPLTYSEIKQRLIGEVNYKETSDEKVLAAIHSLLQREVLGKSGEYYYLVNREKIVTTRIKRFQLSQAKWKEAQKLSLFLKKIPWISALGVTGALAMNNVVDDDDIDFFVVTKKNRLWLVRPILIFYAYLKGKRRSWQKEEENSWCFNLWLEDSALIIPKESRSLYVAYEILQTKWLFIENYSFNRYYFGNTWVFKLFSGYKSTLDLSARQLDKSDFDLFSFFWSTINVTFYCLQRIYMHKHKTNERVSISSAFFHPRDTKGLVYRRWKDSLLHLVAN